MQMYVSLPQITYKISTQQALRIKVLKAKRDHLCDGRMYTIVQYL